jgi:adenosylcobinamide-phosphate guanylyltransferase
MAGGAGSRLGRGEKPLVPVCGRPMISYVTDAFRSVGCEPIVVISPKTTMTANWCRANNIPVVRTAGDGYIEDMVGAVRLLEEEKSVFISVADIPCITPAIITTILRAYHECGKGALSTWVPVYQRENSHRDKPVHEIINGTEACPAGVNILRGDRIGAEQEECALLLDDPQLALNVNTREDLARAEAFLMSDTARANRY